MNVMDLITELKDYPAGTEVLIAVQTRSATGAFLKGTLVPIEFTYADAENACVKIECLVYQDGKKTPRKKKGKK
jgi:hypothetical protein